MLHHKVGFDQTVVKPETRTSRLRRLSPSGRTVRSYIACCIVSFPLQREYLSDSFARWCQSPRASLRGPPNNGRRPFLVLEQLGNAPTLQLIMQVPTCVDSFVLAWRALNFLSHWRRFRSRGENIVDEFSVCSDLGVSPHSVIRTGRWSPDDESARPSRRQKRWMRCRLGRFRILLCR